MPLRYSEIFPAHTVDRPNNMGLVRYVLSLVVLYDHFRLLSGWESAPSLGMSSYHAVGAFFALSGFLVFRSYLNSKSLGDYMERRARRILPPYLTVVLFMALFCCTVSTLTPGEYFTSSGFWKYLGANLTFLNFLHPTLPGVFGDAIRPAVNGSLWTIKEEWALYLSVPIVAWIIWKTRCRPLVAIGIIYVLSIAYRYYFDWLYDQTGKEIYEILSRQFVGQLMYFYSGVAVYFVYDEFKKYKAYLAVAVPLVLISGHYIPAYSYVLEPVAITLMTLLTSLCVPSMDFLKRYYNISYEIYLFHFPIIQLIVHWRMSDVIGQGGSFVASILFTVLFSIASYRLIGHRFFRHSS